MIGELPGLLKQGQSLLVRIAAAVRRHKERFERLGHRRNFPAAGGAVETHGHSELTIGVPQDRLSGQPLKVTDAEQSEAEERTYRLLRNTVLKYPTTEIARCRASANP